MLESDGLLGNIDVNSRATEFDVKVILSWLWAEYDMGDEYSFWLNRESIRDALGKSCLWVTRENGKAVAFQIGNYSPFITNVRKEMRGRGYGTALFEASLARAIRDNVNLLKGECSPPSSLSFWLKHGFEPYVGLSASGNVKVRRVITRDFVVPSDLPLAAVTISFYPEMALYRKDSVPFSVHQVAGWREDSVVLLERRVIGLADDEPEGKAPDVKIEVDGAERCYCNVRDGEARESGIEWDRIGNTFYIDQIRPLGD